MVSASVRLQCLFSFPFSPLERYLVFFFTPWVQCSMSFNFRHVDAIGEQATPRISSVAVTPAASSRRQRRHPSRPCMRRGLACACCVTLFHPGICPNYSSRKKTPSSQIVKGKIHDNRIRKKNGARYCTGGTTRGGETTADVRLPYTEKK